jgi:hypothetical protein
MQLNAEVGLFTKPSGIALTNITKKAPEARGGSGGSDL